jgi:hypothetical protein
MCPKVSRMSRAAVIGSGLLSGPDQTHLHGGERVLEMTRVDGAVLVVVGDQHAAGFSTPSGALRVAQVAGEPGRLAAPVHVVVGLPHVLAAAAEAESLEAHRLQRDDSSG